MGWVDAITDLLNFLHTILVVDFNVGLSAGNDEASAIQSVVYSVILVSFVEHDVLNLVALIAGPADDASIEAGAE